MKLTKFLEEPQVIVLEAGLTLLKIAQVEDPMNTILMAITPHVAVPHTVN